MMRVGLGMVGHAYLEIVIFVCQDTTNPADSSAPTRFTPAEAAIAMPLTLENNDIAVTL